MTNIRFMDEITAPRRSTIHPGHLRQNRRRSLTSSQSGPPAEDIPLAEFMTAMTIEVPQLHLYAGLARELTAWIEESRKICRQAEEDALKMTPALFTEFAMADEVEKQDLLVSDMDRIYRMRRENGWLTRECSTNSRSSRRILWAVRSPSGMTGKVNG